MRTVRDQRGSSVQGPVGASVRRRVGRRRRAAVALIGGGFLVASLGPVGAQAAPAGPALPFDFNGDGYADLTVGIPGEKVGSAVQAGAVAVLPGSAAGPTAVGDQLWHLGRKGVAGVARRGDRYGSALASGDFDRDGFADLVVGLPDRKVGRTSYAGAVQVMYGSPRGLTAARDRLLHQGSRGVPGVNERGDTFGSTLAVGDFDADGYADLAVGVFHEDLGAVDDAGQVVVLSGSASGLSTARTQVWNQASPGVADAPEIGDAFGISLAVGDVNADGRDDLAIGASGEEATRSVRGMDGVVHVLLGSATGLTGSGSQYLTAGSLETSATMVSRQFGSALALADFNADGRDDLAVADHQDKEGDEFGYTRGRVAVFYAGAAGVLDPGHAQVWHLDRSDLPGPAQPLDGFGSALGTGDFTGDGAADLAIGASARDLAGTDDAGAVYLLTGSPTGLTGTPETLIRGTGGVPGTVELGAWFGGSIVGARFSGGATDWLAVGAGGATAGTVHDAGTVTVIPGSPNGLATSASREWHQNSPGVRGTAQAGDWFGSTVR